MEGFRQGRRFCFTWNNPDGVPMRVTFGPRCTYLLYGEEVGENGTPHLQGYVEFDSPVRPSVLMNALPQAHFENARGTVQQNRTYCMKGGIWTEEGVPSGGQGARNDIHQVVGMVRDGVPVKRIAEQFPVTFVRSFKGIERLRDVLSNSREGPPEIIIICGPTGTGKSRLAHEMAPNAYWAFSHQWWDGYEGQADVIWDEFYGASCPYLKLLRILDRYPYTAERKGGTVQLQFRRIIFTSNRTPEEWYQSEHTHPGPWESNPLYRRIRDFGRVIYTGEVHRVVPPVIQDPAVLVVPAPADQRVGADPRVVEFQRCESCLVYFSGLHVCRNN